MSETPLAISRRQWMTAGLVALVAHALLVSLWWLDGDQRPPAPEAPRGVMVSLEAFDAGPPPAASPTPASEAPQPSGPEPTTPEPAPAVPAEAPAASAETEPQQTDIGPTPAQTVEPVAPPQAGSDTAAAASDAAPAMADTVTVRPEAATSVGPDQQVTARAPDLPPSDSAQTVPQRTRHNGAYGDSESATDDYIVRLRAWLSRHKQYPQSARRAEIEGTVMLYIVVDASGNVVSHRIQQSSGSVELDRAAERMLERANPLPAMTTSMQRNRLELIVPIEFSLH